MTADVIPIVLGEQIGAEVLALYRDGAPRGLSTGWPCVDEFFTLLPRQLTLVTGIPGSGKSEWLDALAMNMARQHGWRFSFFSPENHPIAEHVTKLIEKYVGKPANRGPTPRMTEDELLTATEWVTARFRWLAPKHRDPMSLLQTAVEWRHRVSEPYCVIVDPWNALEHLHRRDQTEAHYVSETLTEMIDLCRAEDFCIWLVAHPKVIERAKDGKRPVPTPYDISGGANFYNRADNILCVHRNQGDGTPEVEIHVQKVRFKRAGRVGGTVLHYDRVTGRYRDPNDVEQYRGARG